MRNWAEAHARHKTRQQARQWATLWSFEPPGAEPMKVSFPIVSPSLSKYQGQENAHWRAAASQHITCRLKVSGSVVWEQSDPEGSFPQPLIHILLNRTCVVPSGLPILACCRDTNLFTGYMWFPMEFVHLYRCLFLILTNYSLNMKGKFFWHGKIYRVVILNMDTIQKWDCGRRICLRLLNPETGKHEEVWVCEFSV